MKTGQLIKELRIKKGITQEDLAAKTELNVRTIQRIEKGEVDPRAYTLQSIAKALDVEFETLTMCDSDLKESNKVKSDKWIPLLHLSGLLILVAPPIIIWILKRNEVNGMRKHAIDVINFQLSMTIYSFVLAILSLYPILILLFIYSQVIIILNTIKVTNNQSYKYLLTIRFLKNKQT